jgi:hypothetical protein
VHQVTQILDLSDRNAFELVCEFVRGHIDLLDSKIAKQGIYKSRGYSKTDSGLSAVIAIADSVIRLRLTSTGPRKETRYVEIIEAGKESWRFKNRARLRLGPELPTLTDCFA